MIDWQASKRMVGGRNKGQNDKIDFYETPPEATRALLSVEQFDGKIWEPACGNGAISRVLEEKGYDVVSTDLIERDYGAGKWDFLTSESLAPYIITNPPYSKALDFAKRATILGTQKTAMLLRLVWLEGQRRREFLENSGLARVWVFSKRIPRMHRVDYDGPKSTSSIAFAWFVWEKDYTGAPTLGWINPVE